MELEFHVYSVFTYRGTEYVYYTAWPSISFGAVWEIFELLSKHISIQLAEEFIIIRIYDCTCILMNFV